LTFLLTADDINNFMTLVMTLVSTMIMNVLICYDCPQISEIGNTSK